MDELRIKRYRDKIQHIFEYIQDLPLEPKNELEKRGIFYSLQTSIESLIDWQLKNNIVNYMYYGKFKLARGCYNKHIY